MKLVLLITLVASTIGSSCFADVTLRERALIIVGAQPRSIAITFRIKGNLLRMDTGDATSFVVDQNTGTEMVLVHPLKLCMVTTLAKEQKAIASAQQMAQMQPASVPRPKLRPTGRHSVIGGFNAEEYYWSGTTTSGAMWLTKEIRAASEIDRALNTLMSQGPQARTLPLLDFNEGVPVKSETHVRMAPPPNIPDQARQQWNANSDSTVVLDSVSFESIDDSVFQMPGTYRLSKQ